MNDFNGQITKEMTNLKETVSFLTDQNTDLSTGANDTLSVVQDIMDTKRKDTVNTINSALKQISKIKSIKSIDEIIDKYPDLNEFFDEFSQQEGFLSLDNIVKQLQIPRSILQDNYHLLIGEGDVPDPVGNLDSKDFKSFLVNYKMLKGIYEDAIGINERAINISDIYRKAAEKVQSLPHNMKKAAEFTLSPLKAMKDAIVNQANKLNTALEEHFKRRDEFLLSVKERLTTRTKESYEKMQEKGKAYRDQLNNTLVKTKNKVLAKVNSIEIKVKEWQFARAQEKINKINEQTYKLEAKRLYQRSLNDTLMTKFRDTKTSISAKIEETRLIHQNRKAQRHAIDFGRVAEKVYVKDKAERKMDVIKENQARIDKEITHHQRMKRPYSLELKELEKEKVATLSKMANIEKDIASLRRDNARMGIELPDVTKVSEMDKTAILDTLKERGIVKDNVEKFPEDMSEKKLSALKFGLDNNLDKESLEMVFNQEDGEKAMAEAIVYTLHDESVRRTLDPEIENIIQTEPDKLEEYIAAVTDQKLDKVTELTANYAKYEEALEAAPIEEVSDMLMTEYVGNEIIEDIQKGDLVLGDKDEMLYVVNVYGDAQLGLDTELSNNLISFNNELEGINTKTYITNDYDLAKKLDNILENKELRCDIKGIDIKNIEALKKDVKELSDISKEEIGEAIKDNIIDDLEL